jgi:taurine-pyruvate aminotransferase
VVSRLSAKLPTNGTRQKHKIPEWERDYHRINLRTMPAGGSTNATHNMALLHPVLCGSPLHGISGTEQIGAMRAMGVRGRQPNRRGDPARRRGYGRRACLEPVTAGGGVITPPKAIGTAFREICMISAATDEVVCGGLCTGVWVWLPELRHKA